MKAVTLAGPVYGCDTIHVFDAASSRRLKAALWNGKPLSYLWRYAHDLSLAERDIHLGAGWVLCLLEHVHRAGWQSGGAAQGMIDGKAQVARADALGYPAGCHCGIDLEGLGDHGAPVEAYVRARAAPILESGRKVMLYEGYDDGLDPALRNSLGDIATWWCDFANRPAPDQGFAMHQSAQTVVAGIVVDPDEVLEDHELVGMGDAAAAGLVGDVVATLPPDATAGT